MPMQLRCRRQRMKSSSNQGNSKLVAFDLEHFGHVAADHPADVDAQLLFVVDPHRGLLPCRPARFDVSGTANVRRPANLARHGLGKLTNDRPRAKPKDRPGECRRFAVASFGETSMIG